MEKEQNQKPEDNTQVKNKDDEVIDETSNNKTDNNLDTKKEETEKYFYLVNRRKKDEPIAYITNNKNFWRHKFVTNKDVLIPRPDSEHLVEQTLNVIKKNQAKR